MRKPNVRAVAVTLALAVVALGAAAGAGRAGKAIVWQTDFTKAKSTAKKQKKILLVDFYAEW